MTRRTSIQFLVAWLCLAFGSLASATDDITIIVQPNVTIGAGFGELTPGPHDLSITFQTNASSGYVYAYASDGGGMTIWNYDSGSTPTRPKLVCHGATEDLLGCVYATGYYMDYMNMLGSYMFGTAVANATFPCATLTCNPMNPMSCMYSMGCDPTREGEVEVVPGATAGVAVTVRHGLAGTLTVTGGTSDLQVLDQTGAPFTSVRLDGGGTHGVSLTLRASAMFTGPVQLTARFLNDNGPLDTQDLVKVKKARVKLDKIIVDGSDPPNEGPKRVAVNVAVSLRALPNPAAGIFESGEPAWTFLSKPTASMLTDALLTNPTVREVVSITPDVEGTYVIQATATTTDTFTINAVEPVLVEFRSQYDRVAAGGKDNSAHQTTLTARIDPPAPGKIIKFSISGGGQGVECASHCVSLGGTCPTECLPSRVRAKLVSSGGSYYAGLTSAPLEATTNDSGEASVTLTSSNLADDICTVRAAFNSATYHSTVTTVNPQLSDIVQPIHHPRNGTFVASTRLTFTRGSETIAVPGHRVVNYIVGIERDCTLCPCRQWDLGATFVTSCGFWSRCSMYSAINTYAAVTDGQDAVSGFDGDVVYRITTYDPDGNDNLQQIRFQSRAITALSNCNTN